MAMVTMMLRMVHTMTMLMDGDVDDDAEDGADDYDGAMMTTAMMMDGNMMDGDGYDMSPVPPRRVGERASCVRGDEWRVRRGDPKIPEKAGEEGGHDV